MAWVHQICQISSGAASSKASTRKKLHPLQESFKDPLLRAKFKFVEFIAEKLNTFLHGFQTDQPMVPFLCETLRNSCCH